MTELKTLKDIERMAFQTKRGIHEENLRKAAKEWVDDLLKNFKNAHCKFKYNELLDAVAASNITFDKQLSAKAHLITGHDVIYAMSKIRWIRHFFNLE